MAKLFDRIANIVSEWSGSAWAFTLAIATIAIWLVTGPIFHFSDTWQLIINTFTTLVTFVMVFLIQNQANRDAAAIHVKLDELIRSVENAHNTMIGIEKQTSDEIEHEREEVEQHRADPDDPTFAGDGAKANVGRTPVNARRPKRRSRR
jgi:low affinity Fe/Cu permease